MSREYGQIKVDFWEDRRVRTLSIDAKLLAVYLLTCRHSTMIGAYSLPRQYASHDLGFTLQQFDDAIAELEKCGIALYDPRNEWVIIPEFLRWYPLRNPNQGKAAFRMFKLVPVHLQQLIAKMFIDNSTHLDQTALNQLTTVTSGRQAERVPGMAMKSLRDDFDMESEVF